MTPDDLTIPQPIRINPRNRADQVRDGIIELIRSGAIQAGDKLPTEPQLGEMFGVGRSAIRSAVQSLVGSGLVEMRPGQGAYVRRIDIAELVRLATGVVQLEAESAFELHEARAMIELTAARLAAKRRSDADVQAMSDAIDTYARIQDADDIEGRVDADIAFHDAMIQAARNRILVTMLESISGMIRDHRIQYILRSAKEERDMVVDEHRGILAAVAAANEEEAVRRVRRHMRLIWTQVRQRVDHPEARSPFEEDFLAAVDDDPSST